MTEHAVSYQKMSVLHLTTVHPSNDVRIFERMIRSLLNHEDFGVSLAAPPPAPIDALNFIAVKNPSNSRIMRIINSNIETFTILMTTKYDIYHLHDPETLPSAIFCSLLFKKKFVWDAHEDYLLQLDSSKFKRPWIPQILFNVVRNTFELILKLADRFAVGISCATFSISNRYKNPNTMVVGNEARLEDFKSCVPKYGKRRFLFIGKPSTTNLFRQVVVAISSCANAELHLAWKDVSQEEISFATNTLGDRFKYLGFLNRENLTLAMSESSFGIATYADTPEENSSLSTKFCEFAAAGLPVVCTPTGSFRSIANSSKSAIVSDDFTTKSLGRSIALAINLSAEEWRTLSANSRRWATRSGNWATSETALFELYRRTNGLHGRTPV